MSTKKLITPNLRLQTLRKSYRYHAPYNWNLIDDDISTKIHSMVSKLPYTAQTCADLPSRHHTNSWSLVYPLSYLILSYLILYLIYMWFFVIFHIIVHSTLSATPNTCNCWCKTELFIHSFYRYPSSINHIITSIFTCNIVNILIKMNMYYHILYPYVSSSY